MGKNHISIDEILKHRRLTQGLMETYNDSVDSVNKTLQEVKRIFENTLNCTNENLFKKNYDYLIEKISDPIIANRAFNYPLLVLEKSEFKDNEKYIKSYCETVVPRLDTDSLNNIEDTLAQYDLNDDLKDKIKAAVESNLIADRILVNHKNINERCDDIDTVILNSYRLGYGVVAEQIKDYIDTYNVQPYQKLNLCLEEIYFVLEKNGIKYDKSAMVRAVVESFILSGYDEKKENYIKVLENNYCYTSSEVQNAIDALSDNEAITGTIKSIIDEYIRVGNIPFIDLCTNIGGCSINDISLNIRAALDFMWRCIQSKQISYEEMNSGISAMFETMANKIAVSEHLLSIEDVKAIASQIEMYISVEEPKNKNVLYAEDSSKFDSFIGCLIYHREQFLKDCSYLYNRNNINTIAKLNTESANVVTLQEFKKFRFTNLIKSAINLEKYIKAKAKSVFRIPKRQNKNNLKLKGVVLTTKSGASVVFGEQYDLENYIGEDHKADICVGQYYYDEAAEYECKDFFNSVCKEFNQTIQDKSMQAYYIFNTGIAEVHLKENVYIELTEAEKEIVAKAVDPAEFVYLYTLGKFDKVGEKLVNLDGIFDKMVKHKDMITNEQFELLVEALQYLKVAKEDIEPLAEKYTEFRYRTLVSEGAEDLYQAEVSEIDRILESYEPSLELIPIDIQLEAADIICDILEAGIKKPNIKKADIKKADAGKYHDDDDDEDDEDYDDDDWDDEDENDEENEDKKKDKESESEKTSADEKKEIDDLFDPRSKNNKKGFGKALLNLRLALKGLRAKMGDLGNKEKEASKNLDAGAEHLIKSMHDALVSDRREAIIKGSVIPSFSRCIKASIVMVAAGGLSMVLTGTILPVIIGAVGAFAISKKLTKQERFLLLDDIETELDVVEKEIQNAESKNQMKKYRALLKYKKDLQRQYQRIRYNTRIGKDILPGSATGVYKPQD